MALTVEDPEAQRLAAELVNLTGETLSQAVTISLRERLAAEKRLRERIGLAAELLAIGKRCAPYIEPKLTSTNHGDFLFDDQGLP